MGVKSTADLTVDQARALIRALIPEGSPEEEHTLQVFDCGRRGRPYVDKEFLDLMRGEEPIEGMDDKVSWIQQVVEHAFDELNDGEGYRNFFVVYGDKRGTPEPIRPCCSTDCQLIDLIDEGMALTGPRPGA